LHYPGIVERQPRIMPRRFDYRKCVEEPARITYS